MSEHIHYIDNGHVSITDHEDMEFLVDTPSMRGVQTVGLDRAMVSSVQPTFKDGNNVFAILAADTAVALTPANGSRILGARLQTLVIPTEKHFLTLADLVVELNGLVAASPEWTGFQFLVSATQGLELQTTLATRIFTLIDERSLSSSERIQDTYTKLGFRSRQLGLFSLPTPSNSGIDQYYTMVGAPAGAGLGGWRRLLNSDMSPFLEFTRNIFVVCDIAPPSALSTRNKSRYPTSNILCALPFPPHGTLRDYFYYKRPPMRSLASNVTEMRFRLVDDDMEDMPRGKLRFYIELRMTTETTK